MTGKQEHLGGWIPDAARSTVTTHLSTSDLSRLHLDPQSLDYFDAYRKKYFSDSFVTGQGTEHILEAISIVPEVETWLDVGCGPTTLFWSIPLKAVRHIDCCDSRPEALKVLMDFIRSDEIPECYLVALELFRRNLDHLRKVRGAIRSFIVHDALRVPLLAGRYDLVTAVGLLGLAPDALGYKQAMKNLALSLGPEGWLVGADWVRSAMFRDREGHDNSYLSEMLTREAAEGAGLSVLRSVVSEIEGDPLYDKVIVWVIRRDGLRMRPIREKVKARSE
jgi:SAM-dependent methyltransferase